jgi:hypothetical protein
MQFAHWLMVAGAALVVLGFIGFVVRKNDAEPAGNNLEPTTQSRAEGEEEMSDEKRSTDPGLSAAERKELRGREAKEAIADHEGAQRALHGNLDRLRAERLGPVRRPRGRCFILQQSFRTIRQSIASDFQRGSGTCSMPRD